MDNSNVSTVASVVSGIINALCLQSIRSSSNDGSRDETRAVHVFKTAIHVAQSKLQFSKLYALI